MVGGPLRRGVKPGGEVGNHCGIHGFSPKQCVACYSWPVVTNSLGEATPGGDHDAQVGQVGHRRLVQAICGPLNESQAGQGRQEQAARRDGGDRLRS